MGDTAVPVIDMMNTYGHPDAEKLTPNVAEIIDPLAGLDTRAQPRRCRPDLRQRQLRRLHRRPGDIIRSALEGERPDLVKPIVPDPGTRFLEKVCHSAFYASALAYLLGQRK
jgi:hypothetical protein